MFSIKTILSLLAAGTVMIDSPLPRRVVSKVVYVVAAVVISAILVGALLLAATLYVYQLLITSYGLAPMQASLYIIAVMTILSVIAIVFAAISIRNLAEAIPRSLKKNVPLASHLGNEAAVVAQAFFRGLMGKNEQ